jgi:hypothetical protein
MVDKKQNDKQQPGFMWFRIETFSVTLQTPDVKLFFFIKGLAFAYLRKYYLFNKHFPSLVSLLNKRVS